MRIVSTSSKATPGYKHMPGQTNLADFGFISACPLLHQTKMDQYLPQHKENKGKECE